MKKLVVLPGLIALCAYSIFANADVTLKQAPLTWKQAALNDGEALYMELCAVCHGAQGKGDGPAAVALVKPVTDLSQLSAGNGGEFPQDRVENSIIGKDRVLSHGTIDMPVWGNEFEALRPDWRLDRRKSFARQRIFNLTLHVKALQSEGAETE